MNFNKNKITIKRSKNFLFAVVTCFLLALAFSAKNVFAEKTAPTPPVAAANLSYQAGKDIVLVDTNKATSKVTWEYAVTESHQDSDKAPESGWSEEIPKRTDAGTYYIWYKTDGNEDYSAYQGDEPLKVRISPAFSGSDVCKNLVGPLLVGRHGDSINSVSFPKEICGEGWQWGFGESSTYGTTPGVDDDLLDYYGVRCFMAYSIKNNDSKNYVPMTYTCPVLVIPDKLSGDAGSLLSSVSFPASEGGEWQWHTADSNSILPVEASPVNYKAYFVTSKTMLAMPKSTERVDWHYNQSWSWDLLACYDKKTLSWDSKKLTVELPVNIRRGGLGSVPGGSSPDGTLNGELPKPMTIKQDFDINVTAGGSSDLVLYEWVKNSVTLAPDLKGKFEWDAAPLYFTESAKCQIIFTADNDTDYAKYNWLADNSFKHVVKNGKRAIILDYDINIKVTPRAGWGTPVVREPDKALQWVEPSGRTSIEISGKHVNKYDVLWLLEESDGTKAWYGLDLSNNAFDLNQNLRFYVHWIGPNDKNYKTYYNKLDDATKKSVKNNNGWIFLIGVMDKDGNKVKPNQKSLPIKVYVQIGDDWDLENLKGYFIQEGSNKPVKVTHQRMLYPESKGIDDKYMDDFGVMEMYHLSPYFIYNELKVIKKPNLLESSSTTHLKNKEDATAKAVATGDTINPALIYTILIVATIVGLVFIFLNFKKRKNSEYK